MEKVRRFYIHKRRIGSVRFERNPYGKKGWYLVIQLGPGAGYRWIDLPGYTMNVHDSWWHHLSISGRTLYVGKDVKVSYLYRQYDKRDGILIGRKNGKAKFYITSLSKRCNRNVHPGWW